jgi:hypothetical protein
MGEKAGEKFLEKYKWTYDVESAQKARDKLTQLKEGIKGCIAWNI